jgi:hypothetical protein
MLQLHLRVVILSRVVEIGLGLGFGLLPIMGTFWSVLYHFRGWFLVVTGGELPSPPLCFCTVDVDCNLKVGQNREFSLLAAEHTHLLLACDRHG